MKIKEALKEIAFYYRSNNAVGHTQAMLKGATNTPGVCVLTVLKSKKVNPSASNVSLRGLQGLRGRRSPLLIDHQVLQFLLEDAFLEIERLEEELNKQFV